MKVAPRVGPLTGEGVPVRGGLGETGSATEPVESSPLEAHPDKRQCLCVRPAAASLALVDSCRNCWGVHSELDPDPNHESG